jgi:phage terminase large subunit-like protein
MPQDTKALELNYPQDDFYHMNKPFRAFVGGYRSGKTFLGCVRLCALALEYPGIRLGYFAPTYPQIRDIFYNTIADVAELLGMTAEIKTSTNEVTLYYYGDVHSIIKCRSMEHPARIVGFDINHALIDEIDCMKKEKADQAWKKIVARLSSSGFDEQRLYDEEMDCDLIIEALGENTVDFTTTPEGFNWIYDLFVKQLKTDEDLKRYYGIVHASTRQNAANLPPDYIDKLYATYPSNLVDAYVDGLFVNLTSGGVYTQFDRKLNNSSRDIKHGDTLHIGKDFNVGKMSANVHV